MTQFLQQKIVNIFVEIIHHWLIATENEWDSYGWVMQLS